MMRSLAGQTLVNRYSLDAEVCTKGVGTIYAATDLQCASRPVRAKVLDTTLGCDEEIQRFDRSGIVLKALRQQPWVPRLIDQGVEASLKYFIFENMYGETLAEHLSNHKSLPVSDTLTIALGVIAILEKLHTCGLMYGDLQPANIFFEEEPRGIRLLSFDCTLPTNLSQLKQAGLSEPRAPSTLEAPYWPPDRSRQPADARYDLYALAVVIYELVSGIRLSVLLSTGSALQPIDLVKADGSIDSRLRDFLTHALDPEMAKQFQNAREMSISLKELLPTRTLLPEEPSKSTIKPESPRRSNLHPNDAQLVRVYPRATGGTILEETLPSDAGFEVVVEANTGVTIHDSGAKYFIQIVVRDLTDFTVVRKDSLEGHLTDEQWPEPVLLHPFLVPAPGSAKAYHIYEVLASLSVGVRNPNVSFAISPRFIIYKA
ncbi:MAG: hypothetical protein HYR94_11860 [Chloroflexi bacterium]|nr:hypothetical protein [Chloroflexota bacterium]